MSLSSDFCVIRVSGWEDWWDETRHGSIKTYVSIVLFFLSAVLATPIARCVFFVVRKFTPKKWIWPDNARELMMWQTSLLCRAGLLWIAIVVSRLSLLLCQWPQWLFGVSFIIWMDAGGNVLREIIVRKGTVGYSEHEKPARITLLYEGTTLAKLMLLVLVVYIYYVSPIVDENALMKLLFSTGFFLAIALSTLPLLRNVIGGHYMFLVNMLRLESRIKVPGTTAGTVRGTPLGYIVLDTEDRTRTFIPAGETISTTTEVFHARVWPLRLDIRLSPTVPSTRVRAFVQDLDQLLLYQDNLSAALAATADARRSDSAAPGPESSFSLGDRSARASSNGAGTTARANTKRSFHDQSNQEEVRVIERARGSESYIAVADGVRWVIQFRAFVREETKARYQQTRGLVSAIAHFLPCNQTLTLLFVVTLVQRDYTYSTDRAEKLIEMITNLLEKQQLGYQVQPRCESE